MVREQSIESLLLPSTYLTVLTLIGGGAKYGYEISRLIEERGYRNWVDIEMSSLRVEKRKTTTDLQRRRTNSQQKAVRF
jgi:hypothetical protein